MKTQIDSSCIETAGQPPIQDFAAFLRTLGRDPITGWRWRKLGMIDTINICGRQYVTAEAVAEFKRRAEAGEFYREHKTPLRPKVAVQS